jgi:predicted transcriptional regulator
MNFLKRSKAYAGIVAGSLFLLSSFSNISIAEEKKVEITFNRKSYRVGFDDEKFIYRINPNENKEMRREVLASAIIEDLAQGARKKNSLLEEKIDEFLYDNPSRMELYAIDKDIDFGISHETPLYIEPPKLILKSFKEGKKLQLEFKLDSQDYVIRWFRDSGIIMSWPKDTHIIRRVDGVYELDFDSKDSLGRFNLKEILFPEEKEVAGMFIDSIEQRLKDLAKAKYGIAAETFLLSIKFEEWLEGKEKSRRESKIKSKIAGRNYAEYLPASSTSQTFQSPFEVGRIFNIEFEGKPDRIDFLVNTNLYPSPLNPQKEATSTESNLILLKVISAYIDEPTDKSTAGAIIKLGRTIEERIDEFLEEHENKRLNSFEEKEIFYKKLKSWDSQIYPFITMLEELKERKLTGNPDDIREYKRFKQNVYGIQKAIMPLKSLLIKYEEDDELNVDRTMDLLKIIEGAVKKYASENRRYPESLEILEKEGYIKKLKNDEWGNKLSYRVLRFSDGGTGYEIMSAGRDGTFEKLPCNGDDLGVISTASP